MSLTKTVKKHGTKLAAGAAVIGGLMAGNNLTNPATPKSPCNGVERWPVKTMQDETAGQINLNKITTTTIANLIATAKDPDWSIKDNDRLKEEFFVYTVTANIPYVKLQSDGDIHIELTDPNDAQATLVSEIPNPACPNVKQSPFADKFAAVRSKFLANYQHSYKTGKFKVTGVFFYDLSNHGKGGNANGVEIHPIIDINKI